jgi:hypothetical protein
MKKYLFLFISMMFQCVNASSQINDHKNHFEFSIGGNYRLYFGDKHIQFMPKDTLNDDPTVGLTKYSRFGGFDYQNKFTFSTSFFYNFYFKSNFVTSFGIYLLNQEELLTSSPDTVIFYNSLYDYHRLVQSYQKNTYNIGLQWLLGYNAKRFFIQAGFAYDVVKIVREIETNIDNSINKGQVTSDYLPKYDCLSTKVLVGREIYTFTNQTKISLSSGITFFVSKTSFADRKISFNKYCTVNLNVNYLF